MLSRGGLTKTGEFLGTIDYVAPEQIRETPVDGRADEYSLGCVLYECLTGRVPFPKERDSAIIWAHVEEMSPPPSSLNPELPAAVDEVFSRVLAKRPEDRYASCREFVNATRASLGIAAGQTPTSGTATVLRAQHSASPADVISQRGSVPPPAAGGRAGRDEPAPGSHGRRPRRLWPWVAAVAAVVLIAAGVGVYLGTRGSGSSSGSKGHSMAMGGSHSSTHAMPSLLQNGLKLANGPGLSQGDLPPSSCHFQSATMATCTNPVAAISRVTFRLYPSLAALYSAYQAQVESTAPGPLKTNYNNCSLLDVNGEVSWNHSFLHSTKYSLAQSTSGTLNIVTQAAGRMSCYLDNSGQEHIVWTQDEGRLLASAVGAPHDAVYSWWSNVHHDIYLGGMHM